MRILPALLLACLALPAGPVLADTDYTCLKLCVAGGKPGPVCLPACSYQPPKASGGASAAHGALSPIGSSASTLPGTSAVSTHRLLPVVRLVDPATVVVRPKPPAVTATKDYGCIAKCLQANLRYEMCEESCIEVATTNGSKLSGDQPKQAGLPLWQQQNAK